MLSKREVQIRAVRKRLGDDRIRTFLRAVRSDARVIAIRLANQALDIGGSIDDVFFPPIGDTQDRRRGEHGLYIESRRKRDGTYRITLGYAGGRLIGDGGTWDVAFEGDNVASVELYEQWMC